MGWAPQRCFLQQGEVALEDTGAGNGALGFWVISGYMNLVLGLNFAPVLRLCCGLAGTGGDQEVILLTLSTGSVAAGRC